MKKSLVKFANLSAIIVSGLITATTVFASSDTWVGNTDANWSTDANWTFSSGSTVNPLGDYLLFDAAGSAGVSLTNDLSGYSFAGIIFNSDAAAFTFSGNAFNLTGGITNNAGSVPTINNNITLAGSQTINAASGNITLGGVIDDGGSGYGLTFPGGHNVTLTNASTYSGPTVVYGGGTLIFSGAGCISNSSITIGQTGSPVGSFLTIGSSSQPAGATIIASNLIVTASVIGGNNWNNLNTAAPAVNVTNRFTGGLYLKTGLLRNNMNPNAAGNLAYEFKNFSREPGTAWSFDRGAAPGAIPISSATANSVNVIIDNPPPLLGAGAAGTTSNGIVQGVTIGTDPATYDTTYGLRPLNSSSEQVVFANGLTPGQNVRATGATTLTANADVNSLAMQGSFTISLGGNTLTVDSGWVGSGVNGVIGSAPNDGFLALGAEGFFDVANQRTMTINSVITGNNGLTINLDDLNGQNANVVLAGTNTFSGVTRILANASLQLKLNNSLALQNSTLDYNNYGGRVTFNGPSSFVFGGLEGAQNLPITVPLTLGGDGDSTTYSGALSGAGSLTKVGAGSFTLTGANTYSGGTVISNGVLNINNGGVSSANSAIGTAALTIDGGSIDNTSGSMVTLAPNNAQNWNGDFTFIGTGNLNLGTGLVALDGDRQVTVSANTLTVGGAISGAGFGLTKNGNGTLVLSGANTYSGNTTVSGGTLSLTDNGSIGNSPDIAVSSGATFDVSSISFTLGGSQSLLGSGINNGSIGTSSGSKIYAGTDGGYGTNTFNSNLSLASGAAAYFDLGASAVGANDAIVVQGNLTLNGNAIHIKAPSSSVNLDTTDYTLFTVDGSISGSFAVTPIWDVPPLDSGNYSIVTSGNTVKLHYSSVINPVGTGSANPNPVGRNQSVLITVTVTTPGGAPVNSVTLDATPIGGGSSVTLVEVGATASYTNTVIVGSGVSAGATSLTATIIDSDGGSASVPVSLTILGGSVTWNGDGSDDDWTTSANWISGIAPLDGDAVTFAGATRLTPLMNNSLSLNSITFNSTAGSFVITNSDDSVLTLTGSGVTNDSANVQSLNMPIAMNAAQTFNTAAGNIALGGLVSGTSLTKVGTGTLTLSGTNTYGNGTTVNAGTVVIANNSAFGSGAVALDGGAISNAAGGSYLVANNVTVPGASSVAVGSGDTLTLSGTISGDANLTKIGDGSLVLPSPNSISGGMAVNGGTLVVANNNAIGGGLLTMGNASISNAAGSGYTIANPVNLSGAATVIVGANDTFTLTGVITNSGSLAKTGGGTLTIAGTDPNTCGDTMISDGFLDVQNTSVTPLGNGALTFAGGAIEANGASPITISNNIYAVTNTTTALHPTGFNGDGVTLDGNISGPGNIVVDGSGTTFDAFVLAGDNSGFTGTLTVNQGNDQRFTFGSPTAGSANARFVLNSTGTDNQKFSFAGTNTISFGELSGAGTCRNDGGTSLTTLRIGDLNASSEFDGIFVGNGTAQFGLLKVGTGTLTMTNNNTYTGPTEVAGGELDISVAQGSSTSYQVDDGATLGIINYAGSGLFVGSPGGIASLTVGSNAGATLMFTNLDSSAPYGSIVAVNFTNNGTCTIKIADTNNLVVGNTYNLIGYGAYTSTGAGNFILSSSSQIQGQVINDPDNGELELVVTGFNTNTIATNPTNITTSVSNGNLIISWPSDHTGWTLQAQTNTLDVGLNNNWVDVAGSDATNQVEIPIVSTNAAVFYRLIYQP